MAVESSTTTFKADITNFKAAMSEAARLVRTANSEFKAATAGMEKWSSTTDGLTAKTKQLQTVLSAQERQLEVLKTAYEKVAKEEGEDSKGAQELTIKINNQTAAIKTTQSELDKYEKELNEAGKENEELAQDVNKANDAMEKANEGFTVAKGVLANLVAEGIRLAVSAFKDFATEAFNVGASFEAAMSKVQAVSGASAEEIVQLTDKAKEMGEKTVFSATQSAEAFNYMAMAGWKTEDMLNGIEGIMNLAAASGADLATTSDIVTDALTAFGLEASDAGHFADVLAAASSNANTNVEMMGETFKYAAPIAGALGYSIEDTAVAIGLMANAGIKSSQAGTALRKILTQLNGDVEVTGKEFGKLTIQTTKADGSMRPLADILKDLRSAFDQMTDSEKAANAETIAGKTAMSGLLAMVNASEKDFNKLTTAIDGSTGAAEKMAKTMTDNVQGQLTLLKSNIEGKMIKVFEAAAPAIKSAINEIGSAINSLDMKATSQGVSDLTKGIGEFISYLIKNGGTIIDTLKTIGTIMATVFVVNKLGAFVGMINTMVTAYGSLNGILALVTKSQLALNVAQLASPLGAIIVGVGALTAAFMANEAALSKSAKETYGLSDANKELNNTIAENYNAQQELNKARDENVEAITGEYNRINELKEEYNSLVGANGKVKEGYEERANFIVTELASALGIEKDKVLELIDTNGQLGKSIDELIQKKQAEATLSAYDDSYKKAKAGEKEAIENVVAAQNNATESEKKYNELLKEYAPIAEEYNRYLQAGIGPMGELNDKYTYLSAAIKEAEAANNSNTEALKQANQAYVDGQTTIQNYEGLATAIISNDTAQINEQLTNLTQGFRDAKSATETELQEQVANFEKYYQDILAAQQSGNPVITQEMVNGARDMVEKAKAELEKFAPAAAEQGQTGANNFVEGVRGKIGDVLQAGKDSAENMVKGFESVEGKKTGEAKGKEIADGIKSTTGEAESAGKDIGNSTDTGARSVSGNTAGEHFGDGYVSGILSRVAAAREAGAQLANAANSGVAEEQESNSPSKVAERQGNYYGDGYSLGITAKTKTAKASAEALALSAIDGLNEAQKSHSPSQLTYQSGVNFTKGYINGIASMEKSLVNTIKGLVNTGITELRKLSGYNFSEVASNASSKIANVISDNINYIFGKISYQNTQQIKDFDNTISNLEKERDKALETAKKNSDDKIAKLEAERDKKLSKINTTKKKKKADKIKEDYAKLIDAEKQAINKQEDAIKDQYLKLIDTQKKYKEAYQSASQNMLNEFKSAVNNYQQAATELINDTINGISDKYTERYNALITKQETLISKLKSAGELFTVSSSGVMRIGDLNAQTKQINDYVDKLAKIKSKVSAELFEEIATFDVKEGAAYIDRLLAMTSSDLEAYNKAYTAKLAAAQKASSTIYQSDIKKVASDYQAELNTAFKSLPAQLEALGNEAMKGFVNGLTKNTDYMDNNVKLFVQGMVNQFKSLLKIASPSKVMFALGEYTGEGFADGLSSLTDYVKKAVGQIVDAASSPLGDFSSNISGIKTAVNNGLAPGAVTTGNVVNNYNLVQNNTSPKALTALETYRARRQQISLIKAFAP